MLSQILSQDHKHCLEKSPTQAAYYDLEQWGIVGYIPNQTYDIHPLVHYVWYTVSAICDTITGLTSHWTNRSSSHRIWKRRRSLEQLPVWFPTYSSYWASLLRSWCLHRIEPWKELTARQSTCSKYSDTQHDGIHMTSKTSREATSQITCYSTTQWLKILLY